MCVCVCVWRERERQRHRDRDRVRDRDLIVQWEKMQIFEMELVHKRFQIWYSNFIIIIIIISWKFFTSTLADGFSLEFEWKQVSPSLQDYSQYSGRSQQCCSLHGLDSTCSFHVLGSLLKSFSYCTEALITIGIIVTFMFLSFFNSLARSRYLSLFSHCFNFNLLSAVTAKFTFLQVLSF